MFVEVTNVTKVQVRALLKSTYQQKIFRRGGGTIFFGLVPVFAFFYLVNLGGLM